MKIGILYYSRTGNTRQVAKTLEEKFKEKNAEVDLIEIEHVPQSHGIHEDGIHDRVDAVGHHVGDGNDVDIGLAFDPDQLLLVDIFDGDRVNGFGLPGLDTGDFVRRLIREEQLPIEGQRARGQKGSCPERVDLVPEIPIGFLLFHEAIDLRKKPEKME